MLSNACQQISLFRGPSGRDVQGVPKELTELEGFLERQKHELIPEGSSDIREKCCLVGVTILKFRSFEQDVTQAGKCLQRCGFIPTFYCLKGLLFYSFVVKTRKKESCGCVTTSSQFWPLVQGSSWITRLWVCRKYILILKQSVWESHLP